MRRPTTRAETVATIAPSSRPRCSRCRSARAAWFERATRTEPLNWTAPLPPCPWAFPDPVPDPLPDPGSWRGWVYTGCQRLIPPGQRCHRAAGFWPGRPIRSGSPGRAPGPLPRPARGGTASWPWSFNRRPSASNHCSRWGLRSGRATTARSFVNLRALPTSWASWAIRGSWEAALAASWRSSPRRSSWRWAAMPPYTAAAKAPNNSRAKPAPCRPRRRFSRRGSGEGAGVEAVAEAVDGFNQIGPAAGAG